MDLKKELAQKIWNDRQWVDGYVEDRDEWLDAMDISHEEMDAFEAIVQNAIDSLDD